MPCHAMSCHVMARRATRRFRARRVSGTFRIWPSGKFTNWTGTWGRLKLPHNNPVFVAEGVGSYARGVRTGCHSCHKGDQNTLISLIATQASCRTRGSRVRKHSGWAIPNLPVVTRAPIVACGNGFVMRRRAIAFLCHVVSLFGYPAAPSVRRRRLEGVHVGRRAGL